MLASSSFLGGCPAPRPAGQAEVGATGEGPLRVLGVSTWKDGAKGAYSIVHDDICEPAVDGVFEHALPELALRQLKVGLGAIASRCTERNIWDKLRAAAAAGHELISHSWSHVDLAPHTGSRPSYAIEIDQARASLEKNGGKKITFFVFPYDSYDENALDHLRRAGYLGARATPDDERGVNRAEYPDDFHLKFDTYGPRYSVYMGQGPCTGIKEESRPEEVTLECRKWVMRKYVDDILAVGGFGIREVHGVEDTAWETMPLDEYRTHLDYVQSKIAAGELWVDTPTHVLSYRRARDACAAPSASGWTLRWKEPSADCRKYAVTLTWILSTRPSDPAALSAEQEGAELAVRKIGPRKFLVDADPTGGDVNLRESAVSR